MLTSYASYHVSQKANVGTPEIGLITLSGDVHLLLPPPRVNREHGHEWLSRVLIPRRPLFPWECLSGNMPFCYSLLDISIDPMSIICLLFVWFLLFVSGFRPPSAWLKHPTKWFPHGIANSTTQVQPIFFHISVNIPPPCPFSGIHPSHPLKGKQEYPCQAKVRSPIFSLLCFSSGIRDFFQVLPSILIIYQQELGTRGVFPILWFPSHFGAALLASLFPFFTFFLTIYLYISDDSRCYSWPR